MRLRRSSCWVLLGLLLLPAAARPGQKEEAAGGKKAQGPPTLVLRVRSIDTVVGNAKLFARLAGKEELGDQLEALLKAQVGESGLKGIDPARPVGLYARAGEDLTEASAVLLVPVADEKAFLALLENVNYRAEKDKGGVYVIQQDAVPIHIGFRFAHRYAYVTAFTGANALAIDPAGLIPPARLFPKDLRADVSGTLRIDQIPKTARDLALDRLEADLARAKEKKERGETEAQHKARGALIDSFVRQAAQVLESGQELRGRLDIDREKKELSVRLDLTALPGSRLAGDVRALGEQKSLFGGLMAKGAALNGLAHLVLPEGLRKALEPVIDEGQAEAIKKETNEAKRREMERFARLLAPTLKAGELDAAFSLRGPHASKRFTFVAGLKLKNGAAVEQAVRDLLRNLPPAERALVKLDVETVNGTKVHRIEAQQKFDEAGREAFGDHPVYVAFRDDAVFLALGEEGLEAIKEAVAARPEAAPPLLLEVSMARLARTLAKTDAERQAAAAAFTGGSPGRVRLTLTGGPGLGLHFRTDLSVVRFAGAAYQARKQPTGDGQ